MCILHKPRRSVGSIAIITLLIALSVFFLMAFRKIPEIVFWAVIIPCAIIAYWVVPKMKGNKKER